MTDLAGRAACSATGASWSETFTDYRNMNTDVRSSAIVLLALVQLRPEEKLLPDAVRWLMAARQGERWGTTQENAWAILALTEWMAQSGELTATIAGKRCSTARVGRRAP